MIQDTERFTQRCMSPPYLARREVMFGNGASSATTGLGRRITELNDTWQSEHLPHNVPMYATHSPHADKASIRRWLNKNIQGLWCFAMPPDGTTAIMAVRFSDQTEASAFRLFWC
jgi:hypothetical protein